MDECIDMDLYGTSVSVSVLVISRVLDPQIRQVDIALS